MKTALGLVLAILVAGCNRTPEAKPGAEADAERAAATAAAPAAAPAPAAPPSLAKVEQMIAYECDKSLPVTAAYGTNAAGRPDVTLVIRGVSFALERDAADPQRFAGAEGLEPGKGLVWTLDGKGGAALSEVPADRLADRAATTVVRHCRQK